MRVPGDDGRYRLRGSDLIAYANGSGEHRYSLRGPDPRGCDSARATSRRATPNITTIHNVRLRGTNLFFGLRLSGTERNDLTGGLRSTASLLSPGWAMLREAANLSLSPGGIETARLVPPRLAVNGIDPLRDPTWLREMRDRGFSARSIATASSMCGREPVLNTVSRIFGLRATNPTRVWRHNHSTPWNRGRRYSNLSTRGIAKPCASAPRRRITFMARWHYADSEETIGSVDSKGFILSFPAADYSFALGVMPPRHKCDSAPRRTCARLPDAPRAQIAIPSALVPRRGMVVAPHFSGVRCAQTEYSGNRI